MKFQQHNIDQSETGIGGTKLSVELYVINEQMNVEIMTFDKMLNIT